MKLGVPLGLFGTPVPLPRGSRGLKASTPVVGFEVEANQSENLAVRSARGEFDGAFFKQEIGSLAVAASRRANGLFG